MTTDISTDTGELRLRAYVAGEDEHRLFGSIAWIEKMRRRAEENGKAFRTGPAISLMMRWYIESRVDQINTHGETETGRQLHPGLINHTEISKAIYRLTPMQNGVFKYFHEEGWSIEDIAVEMDISVSCAKRHLSYANAAFWAYVADDRLLDSAA